MTMVLLAKKSKQFSGLDEDAEKRNQRQGSHTDKKPMESEH